MLDAHAHVMQVKLCKANTRGVTVLVVSALFICHNLRHGGLRLDGFFTCCSAESTEVLQPLATDDGRHVEEPVAPHAKQAQVRLNPVTPIMEQQMVAEPTAPTME